MTISLRIVVPGQPVAKGRPRFSSRGGFVRSYTPGPTRAYEAEVAIYAREAMVAQNVATFVGPLNCTITVRLERPNKPKNKLHPITRPDLDNYVKAAMDGMQNGRVFADDSQIIHLVAHKEFAADPAQPEMVIYLVTA